MLDSGEERIIGINEGDAYSVDVERPDYAKVAAFSNTLKCGDVEQQVYDHYENTLGDDFNLTRAWIVKGGTLKSLVNANEVLDVTSSMSANLKGVPVVRSTFRRWRASISGTALSFSTTIFKPEGTTGTSKTEDITIDLGDDFSGLANNTEKENRIKEKLPEFEKYIADTYNVDGLDFTARNDIKVKNGGISSTTKEKYYYIYQQVQRDEVTGLPCPANNITLTYSATVSTATDISLNLLNNERFTKIDEVINNDLINEVVKKDGLLKEIGGFELENLSKLLGNESVKELAGILSLDNMPHNAVVTLKEVDLEDGYYEGLSYNLPYENAVMATLSLDELMSWAMSNGDIIKGKKMIDDLKATLSSPMLDMEYESSLVEHFRQIGLPISLGSTYALKGIRAGVYEISVTAPGDGWVASAADGWIGNTFRLKVSPDGTVENVADSSVLQTKSAGYIQFGPVLSAFAADYDFSGFDNGTYAFTETGVWFNHVPNEITFTDVATVKGNGSNRLTPLAGAQFTLFNRDQLLNLTNGLLALGEDAVGSVANGIEFSELLGLRTKIAEGIEELEWTKETTDQLLNTIIALDDRLVGVNLPIILQTVSDESGAVTFTPDSNVTVDKLTSLVSDGYKTVTAAEDAADTVSDNINELGDSISKKFSDFGNKILSLFNFGKKGDAEVKNDAQPLLQSVTLLTKELPALSAGEEKDDKTTFVPDVDIPGVDATIDGDTLLALLAKVGDPELVQTLNDLYLQINTMPDKPKEPDQPGPGPDQPGPGPGPDEPTEPEPTELEIIMDLLDNFGNNPAGYAALNALGLMDGKFPTGDYILVQTAAPNGYIRSTSAYTFRNRWNGSSYVTYANAGVSFPFLESQLEQFNEALKADISSYVDSKLTNKTSGASSSVSKIFNGVGSILGKFMKSPIQPLQAEEAVPEEVNAEVNREEAATVAYAADLIYNSSNKFPSPEIAADALLKVLDADKDYSVNRVSAAVRSLADDAAASIAGRVDKNWYFYNFSDSFFRNAKGLFSYVVNKFIPAKNDAEISPEAPIASESTLSPASPTTIFSWNPTELFKFSPVDPIGKVSDFLSSGSARLDSFLTNSVNAAKSLFNFNF